MIFIFFNGDRMKFKSINILLIFNIICLMISLVIKKNNLYGKVIVIDPGHGGKDNGAEVNNVLEDEINLNISKLLYQKLFDQGCIVHITRVGDYDLAPQDSNSRKMKDLKRRVQFINEVDADLFISIHLNIYEQSNVNGIQVFYQEYKDESEKLAKIIQDKFNKNLNKKSKKHKIGDYYILNHTYPIGVLIECGFLTNNEERDNLIRQDYQNLIVNSINEGIIKYYS